MDAACTLWGPETFSIGAHVEVFTDQNNIAAMKLFEKNGFRAIYSGITLSQYLMEKSSPIRRIYYTS